MIEIRFLNSWINIIPEHSTAENNDYAALIFTKKKPVNR